MNTYTPGTLQEQLKKELYEKIRNKEWMPGHMIPSERELCEEYCVSRITVREALKELVQAGYLVRKQGKGTFVAIPTVEHTMTSDFSLSQVLKESGTVSKFKMISFEKEKASSFFQNLFKITEDEIVVHITRIRTINGEAYAYEEATVPEKYLMGATEQDIDQKGLYPTMKACSDVFPESAQESVEAAICPDNVASLMGLKGGKKAVFRIKRYTMAKNECVEYCKSYVYGQRYNCTHIIRQK